MLWLSRSPTFLHNYWKWRGECRRMCAKQRFVSLWVLCSNQEDKGKIQLGWSVGSLSPLPFCTKSNAVSAAPFPRLQLALWDSKGHVKLCVSPPGMGRNLLLACLGAKGNYSVTLDPIQGVDFTELFFIRICLHKVKDLWAKTPVSDF